jgi:hypothetical protein
VLVVFALYAQDIPLQSDPAPTTDSVDTKALSRLDNRCDGLAKDITNQSEKTLDEMEKRELRLKDKFMLKDTMVAKKLFGDIQTQIRQLSSKLTVRMGLGVQSIWANYEYNALVNNPNVWAIIYHF